jgi:DNA ligase 1
MLLLELAELSGQLAKTRKRGEKTALLAGCFERAQPEERGLVALYLSGAIRQTKLGVGAAQLYAKRSVAPSERAVLTVAELDERLTAIAECKGAGSAARRAAMLGELFARASEPEQSFLPRLIMGELRQGALESLVLDALAKAACVPVELVRRAQMLSADLGHVADVAFRAGAAGLSAIDIELFRPVQPMLAEPAEDVADAVARLGRAAFEVKLDGARVQVHRRDDDVRVYTRGLNEVTSAVPELVTLVRALPARELILDGEVIALRENGSPLPFQETMRRFGRKLDVASLTRELPLSSFFFDCLYVDGRSLLSAGTEERAGELARIVPSEARVARLVSDSVEEVSAFFAQTLARGHEGLMAKALHAPYAAGSRGASWLKLKHAHTLDLVVLAAEWGSGRRTGTLSNLHLGARDAEQGGFVMLGKTFKGLTDELLAWQTEALLARETHRDAYTVYVRPELVVEIEFNDVQTSPHYPGGLALRFARVKRYRPDKDAQQADTIEQVRAIHRLSHGEGS